MSTAFIIGNGKSREPIPLEALKQHGKIYACNAVYREFEPDYLIAVDTKMISEINRHKWQYNHEVWTNPNKIYKDYNLFNFFDEPLGWSSGPTALWLATYGDPKNPQAHQNDPMYLLGFDFKGIDADTIKGEGGSLNNIYADTENYKKTNDPATYHGNWARQVGIICQKNPQKRYIRVVQDKEDYCPDNLVQLVNFSHMTTAEFMENFKILQS